MRGLLDVNVLIALLDRDHALHTRSQEWFGANVKAGWASCPLTQNGCVRIMSHSSYPNALAAASIIERLRNAVAESHHQFWADDVSLLDTRIADPTRIHGPRQVTDLYLLALAVRHGGRFVTFDRSVPIGAIRNAEKKHLVIL